LRRTKESLNRAIEEMESGMEEGVSANRKET